MTLRDMDGLTGSGLDEKMVDGLAVAAKTDSTKDGFDADQEWIGLPAYHDRDVQPSIVLEFSSRAEREAFLAKTGWPVDKLPSGALYKREVTQTWSLQWPPAPRHDNASLRFVGSHLKPRYPIYIPTKGRADILDYNATATYFIEAGVPFSLVVEPQEFDAYAARYGAANVLTLPFSNLGQGSIPARNWLKQHALSRGAARHWCVDDNIWGFVRDYGGRRIPCDAGAALRIVEDLTDRYENVAIAGLNYRFFGGVPGLPPFFLNVHVYSCMLIASDLPYAWRGRYNEDTDLCLQALTSGQWCTMLVNAFLCNKMTTLSMKGGNMTDLYQGDGRLEMARSLERQWPGLVTTERRFGRPQHVIKNSWRLFDLRPRRRPDVDFAALPTVDERGLDLVKTHDVKSPMLQQMLDDWEQAKLLVE